MKNLLVILCLVPMSCTMATADDWFDMQNCGICKCMGDNMEIMQDITWETHMLPNGIMTISVIPEEHKKTMTKLHDEMMASVKRLEEGEAMELCGHCMSYGELLSMGVNKQEIESEAGMITLMTSEDPEVVKKIHAHAQKSLDEYKKMMEMQQAS